jgi:hypothetical protein
MEVLKKKKDIQEYLTFFRENYLGIKPKVTTEIAAVTLPVNDYKGPYKSEQSKENVFALVFQPSEIDGNKLINSFTVFNASNFGSPSIKISIDPLDDFRSMLLVSGLGEHKSALAYFTKAISDKALLLSLKNINYRNFIISADNLKIFKKEKNLLQYMDLFNRIK